MVFAELALAAAGRAYEREGIDLDVSTLFPNERQVARGLTSDHTYTAAYIVLTDLQHHHIKRFRPPIALTDPLIKAYPPIFAKVVEAGVGDRRNVNEHVFGAVGAGLSSGAVCFFHGRCFKFEGPGTGDVQGPHAKAVTAGLWGGDAHHRPWTHKGKFSSKPFVPNYRCNAALRSFVDHRSARD